jgi:asparagine synthase (glutamine-hydrolysing)
MCGISGYYSKSSSLNLLEYYENHKKIAHRGPDDEGFVVCSAGELEHVYGDDTIDVKCIGRHIKEIGSSNLVLGHRRLSIIDLSERGHQPYRFECFTLVYNGEVYNYIELREELISLGYSFDSDSDTEVFIKGYHCWGVDAFNKFNGMWAAAIYDEDSGHLILTRDRFGVKPLYYIHNEDREEIYFCSEIKGLTGYFESLAINESAVYSYLRYTHLSHDDETFFKGIKSLTPGSVITFDGSLDLASYYQLKPSRSDLSSTFSSAIEIRKRTDTEFGVMLSGGVDSSLIAASLKQGDKKIKSFTADFKNSTFSEKSYVDITAEKNDLESHFVYPSVEGFSKDFDDFLLSHEYPLRSLSAYSQYKIYQYISQETDVKVIFSGQGADEIFSGYTNDYYVLLSSLLKQGKLINFAKNVRDIKEFRGLSLSVLLKGACRYLLRDYVTRYDPYGVFLKKIAHSKEPKFAGLSLFKQYQRKNIQFSSLREYFRDEDRNSMRFSIEARLPFMDYRMVEAGLALAPSEMIVEGVTKTPLRNFAKGKVSDSILQRRDKMGFVSPQEVWQKNELKLSFDSTFEEIRHNGLAGVVDGGKVFQLYRDYQAGVFTDWAFIWRCYCLHHFVRVWNIK